MGIKEILRLSPAERIEIAEQIWDSLKSEDIPITKAQKDEIDSRIALDKEGRMSWFSIEDVKARLDSKS